MMSKLDAGYRGALFVDAVVAAQPDLPTLAAGIRSDIIRIAYATRAHHIGPALSCVDILVALYFQYLQLVPIENRDFFFLSKGHAALALYVVLAARRLLPVSRLRMYCEAAIENGLGQHPLRATDVGVEVTSGALGHGLSIGAGCALASRRASLTSRAVVLLGDGELDEGMVWEAVLFAAHHRLGNLVAIVDRNHMQCLGRTDEVLSLHPVSDKFKAFGWRVREVDGHDITAILSVLSLHDVTGTKPLALLAETTKGKGISFMETSVEWHHKRLDDGEFLSAMSELDRNA